MLDDINERRGRLYPSANPIRFVELAGGEEIHYAFYEPDPVTCRSPYWYNTRLNVLYKKKETPNALTGITDYSWVNVSQL